MLDLKLANNVLPCVPLDTATNTVMQKRTINLDAPFLELLFSKRKSQTFMDNIEETVDKITSQLRQKGCLTPQLE